MPRAAKMFRRLASAVAFTATVGLAALMLLPAVLGYERYVIVSGSMTGTVDTGSIVYDKPVPTAGLQRGDIITYAPPAGASPQALVTHRIASITRGPKGERVFRTKGDANEHVDPWTFTLPAATQAKVDFHVPYVGYAFAALAIREVRMAVIGGPAVLIALVTLFGLLRTPPTPSAHAAPPVAATRPPPQLPETPSMTFRLRSLLALAALCVATIVGAMSSGAAFTSSSASRSNTLTAAADWVGSGRVAQRSRLTAEGHRDGRCHGIRRRVRRGVGADPALRGRVGHRGPTSAPPPPLPTAARGTPQPSADGAYDLRAIAIDNAANSTDRRRRLQPPRGQHGADGCPGRPGDRVTRHGDAALFQHGRRIRRRLGPLRARLPQAARRGRRSARRRPPRSHAPSPRRRAPPRTAAMTCASP